MNKKLTIGTTIIGVIICKLVFDKFKEAVVRDILADMAKPRGSISKIYNHMSSSRSYLDKPNDFIFDTRGDAEDILYALTELINSEYGFASVADLNGLIGSVSNFTDTKYGWTDLKDATIIYSPKGYLLVLPKVEVLK